MSIVNKVRSEFQLWQAWWRPVEAFIERIDEAKDTDLAQKRKFEALLLVATAIEDERRLRLGTGLLPPLEIAQKRGAPLSKDLKDELEDKSPAERGRVPGAYDLEIAVAPINILPLDQGKLDLSKLEDLEKFQEEVDQVKFTPNGHPIFSSFYDEAGRKWREMTIPDYDFGTVKVQEETDGLVASTRDGLYAPELRRIQSMIPPLPEPFKLPSIVPTWSSIKSLCSPPSPQESPSILGGGNPAKLAATARDLCLEGAKALEEAAEILEDDTFDELEDENSLDEDDAPDPAPLFLGKLKKAAGAFRARAEVYRGIAQGQTGTEVLWPLGDLGNAIEADVAKVLDAVVEARIKAPDGTMRSLRAMEWAFSGFWWSRLFWFTWRRDHHLTPLFRKRFLRTFIADLAHALAGQPTSFPFPFDLPATRPLFTTGEHLPLPDGISLEQLALLKPGMIAVIDGDRKAIAVVRGLDPSPDGKLRIRVMPLSISMAAGSKLPGVAGMITTGRISAGPIDPALRSAASLRDGAAHGRPQDDGLPQELAAHWSRLCLIRGWQRVHDWIKGDLPTHLGHKQHLPVLGPVKPGAHRFVLDPAALAAHGFDLDGPKKPIIARPGEMLLIRGTDKSGTAWQDAVEVLTITRTTADKVDEEDPAPPPLGKPICCQDPGDRVVVTVKHSNLPEELVRDITLHREFRGFGAPSLAVGRLLPEEVDPDSHTSELVNGHEVYRGPELVAAREILDRWLWTR